MTPEEAFKAGYMAGWENTGEGDNAEWCNKSSSQWLKEREQAWLEYQQKVAENAHRS